MFRMRMKSVGVNFGLVLGVGVLCLDFCSLAICSNDGWAGQGKGFTIKEHSDMARILVCLLNWWKVVYSYLNPEDAEDG